VAKTPNQIQAELNKLLEENKSITTEIAALTGEELTKQISINASNEELLVPLKKQLELRQQIADKLKEELQTAQQQATQAAAIYKDQEEAHRARLDAFAAEKRHLESLHELGELDAKQLREALELLDKKKKKLEEIVSVAKALGEELEGAFGMDYSVNFVGTMNKIGTALSTTEGAAMLFQKAMVGIATAAINNMVGLVKALYDAENEFRKATGASVEFASSLRDVYETTRIAGATIEDASAAMTSLHGTYTDFTMQSKATREELAETAVVLGRLGVGHEEFAKGVQMSTKAFGVSAGMADNTMRELVAHAKDLGVAPQRMMQDFAGAGNTLAKFGDQGVKAFKDMQYAAKITGMEMDKILGIANKFDTFEDAAGMAGKLNAALGGNFVNAMDMMMETDPAERFNMVRDSILDAGLSFDEMSYYQKQFYTESLGLSDVGDLAMMLSGNMDGLTGALGKNSDALVAQKKNAAAVQKLSEQWNAVLAESVVIIEPLIDLLRGFMGFLIEYSEIVAALIVGSMAYIAVMKVQSIWTATLALAQGSLATATWMTAVKMGLFALAVTAAYFVLFKKKSSPTFFVGIGLLAGSFKALGTALKGAAKPMLAIGAAALMVGGGIAIAALGLAELVKAFQGLGVWAIPAAIAVGVFTVAFMGMMVAIVALVAGPQAVVVAGAVGVLLAVGGAALMMGGGLALAALGLAQLVKSFAALFEVMPIVDFMLFVATLGAFGYVMIALGAAAPFAALGLGVLGTAMLYLGLGLMIMQPLLETLAEFMGSISNLVESSSELVIVAEQFERISAAVKSIPDNKAVSMSVLMATAARAAMTAAPTAAAAATGAQAFAATTPATSSKPDRPYEVTINFEIDGDKICDKVVKCTGGECRDALLGT